MAEFMSPAELQALITAVDHDESTYAWGEVRRVTIVTPRLLLALSAYEAAARKFALRQRVRKVKGSSWQGPVVGFYSTELTPIGYCVESEREPGSVQLYPEAALEAVEP
jgi:hypothetical protein